VEKYAADPLCGYDPSNELWLQVLHLLMDNARPENRARIPKALCGGNGGVGLGRRRVLGNHAPKFLGRRAEAATPGFAALFARLREYRQGEQEQRKC